MKLTGKTILITGASSGIGKSMALRVAKDGATVLLAARSKNKLAEVAKEVEKLGGKAEIILCDVTDLDQVKNMFLTATQNNRVLDVVFDNAGLGFVKPLIELNEREILEMINVNVTGMIVVAKYATEVFSRQRYGHLMITSSMAGFITLPDWSVYVATKWAALSFADSIRYELKPLGIKVTTIHPGAVSTEFFDSNKANIDTKKMGGSISPELVAQKSYDAIFTNKHRVLIPFSTNIIAFLYQYFPWLTKFLIQSFANNISYHDNDSKGEESDFDYIKKT